MQVKLPCSHVRLEKIVLASVSSTKYFGHILHVKFSDDEDMMPQMRLLYMRININYEISLKARLQFKSNSLRAMPCIFLPCFCGKF